MLTLLRVLFGFIIACLVAGAVIVAFAVGPVEAKPEQLGNAGVLALLAATHSAIFAFPFALVANSLGELWRVRSWLYYVLVAVAIALGGFAAEYMTEVGGQPSILNNYAVAAFLTVGVLSGLAYWLVAGRRAGGKRGDTVPPAPAAEPPAGTPVAEAT